MDILWTSLARRQTMLERRDKPTGWLEILRQLGRHRELIGGIVLAGLMAELLLLDHPAELLCSMVGTVLLVPAAVLDAYYFKLYHRLTGSMLLAGLLVRVAMAMAGDNGAVWDGMAGSLCFGGLLLLLYVLSGPGRLGFGDVCYGSALGMFLGLEASLPAFYLTFAVGMVAALGEYACAAVIGRRRRRLFPLGPFMAMGSLLSILYGRELMAWYLGNF